MQLKRAERDIVEFTFDCSRCSGHGMVTLDGHAKLKQEGASFKSFKHQRFTDPIKTVKQNVEGRLCGTDLVQIYIEMPEKYDVIDHNSGHFAKSVFD